MKKRLLLFCTLIIFLNCKKESSISESNYASFGSKITADSVLSKEEMLRKYKNLKINDTLIVKFKSKILTVCQAKGCWMNLELSKSESAFVKFKDYGFFMPLNCANDIAIVSGKAFVSVESIDELKHYAKDEGKSAAAIDSIVAPKTNYSFIAAGVLIEK
jgi:hypothetical protein